MNPKPNTCSKRSLNPPDESSWQTRACLVSPDCTTREDGVVTHLEEDDISRLEIVWKRLHCAKEQGSFSRGSGRGFDYYRLQRGCPVIPCCASCTFRKQKNIKIFIKLKNSGRRLSPRFVVAGQIGTISYEGAPN